MTISPKLYIVSDLFLDFYDDKDQNLSQTKNHFKGVLQGGIPPNPSTIDVMVGSPSKKNKCVNETCYSPFRIYI